MKLYKLEALRGFAALYVVFHHSLPHHYIIAGFNLGNLARFGQEAVILFFLLSGFVINYSFQRSADKSFSRYFLKRFGRIYIPLAIVLLLGYLIECSRQGGWINPEPAALLRNLLMLQDAGDLKPNTLASPYMHNSPLWSLSYEWWFYMLYFPLATCLAREGSRNALVLGGSVLAAIAYVFEPHFVSRLLMYMAIWWSGVYLSNRYLLGEKIRLSNVWPILLVLSAITLVLAVNAYFARRAGSLAGIGVHPLLELRHVAFALVALGAALLWQRARWFGFDFLFKPFLRIAPISYVIYISHHYFVTDAHYFSAINNPVLEFTAYLACLLAFSYVVELRIYPVLQKRLVRFFKPRTQTARAEKPAVLSGADT